MATPRCPFCNAQGINQIEAKSLGPVLLLYCKNCGAIHGVIQSPPVPHPPVKDEPVIQQKPFELKPLEQLEEHPRPNKPLTPQQAALLQKHMVQHASPYRIILTGDDPEGEAQ